MEMAEKCDYCDSAKSDEFMQNALACWNTVTNHLMGNSSNACFCHLFIWNEQENENEMDLMGRDVHDKQR